MFVAETMGTLRKYVAHSCVTHDQCIEWYHFKNKILTQVYTVTLFQFCLTNVQFKSNNTVSCYLRLLFYYGLRIYVVYSVNKYCRIKVSFFHHYSFGRPYSNLNQTIFWVTFQQCVKRMRASGVSGRNTCVCACYAFIIHMIVTSYRHCIQ